ncbi:hypothetical protein BTJ68_12745, partial [Hortaea werneckii EXF-2000]
MGLLSYVKPGKASKDKKDATPSHAEPELTEKPATTGDNTPRPPITPGQSTPGSPSPWGSRPASLYPAGDWRNSQQEEINEINRWSDFGLAGGHDEGVILKKGRGAYTCCPADIVEEPYGFFKAVETLNVRTAMTVNTRVIKLFLHNNDRPFVPLKGGLRLQVLPDMSYLPRCQKHQFAAFIADRGILVVWDDEPRHLLDRAAKIEQQLMEMIWDDETTGDDEKKEEGAVEVNEISQEEADLEAGAVDTKRGICMWMPIISAFTLCLTVTALGSGCKTLQRKSGSMGTTSALVGNIAQLIGPISQMQQNSKFYSGQAPKRLHRDVAVLPHVTIQMPVYKEGLQSVIEPTIRMRALARTSMTSHNIGWVARPKHNPKPKDGSEVFLRRGKFKKASNMNYAMWVSVRVEEKLKDIQRHEQWTQEDEAQAYREALNQAVEEDQGRTWADGNIRIGDYILIIDSDTRVPTDCFLDAVSEMEQCPQVAIIQYPSGVMNITDSFFERGITFFTNLVYTQIRYAVANGDVAPFVGHNAIMRWAAMQEIAYDAIDGDEREKYWSEET